MTAMFESISLAITPQWFVWLARNFIRRREIHPQWRLDAKNFEFWKFKMADGFAPKRYERRCYNLLLGTMAYRLDHRGDTLIR